MLEVHGVKETDLMRKVAVVAADGVPPEGTYFVIPGEQQDCTGFFNWIRLWEGRLYGYESLKKHGTAILEKYKIVIFDGYPSYLNEIAAMATQLKGKVVTMFQPEGDISLYDVGGIQTYSETPYRAWNACDVIIPMEDNEGYYRSLTDTPVRFVHPPIDEPMEEGKFRVPREKKSNRILIYGDNNCNGPIAAVGCARRLKKPLTMVQIRQDLVDSIKRMFGVEVSEVYDKQGQYRFLQILGACYLHIYPTRNVGAAREPIACAVAGTPCIGSDRSHTNKRLFPELVCDVYDIDKMVELATRLYEDTAFYDSVVEYAWKALDYYTIKSAKTRMMEAYALGKGI